MGWWVCELAFGVSRPELRFHVFRSFESFAQHTPLVSSLSSLKQTLAPIDPLTPNGLLVLSQANLLERCLPAEWKQAFTAFLQRSKQPSAQRPPLAHCSGPARPVDVDQLLFGVPIADLSDSAQPRGKRSAAELEPASILAGARPRVWGSNIQQPSCSTHASTETHVSQFCSTFRGQLISDAIVANADLVARCDDLEGVLRRVGSLGNGSLNGLAGDARRRIRQRLEGLSSSTARALTGLGTAS
eukprot:920559-Rhodomonas_salina.1